MTLRLLVGLLVVSCGSAPARRPPPSSTAQPPSVTASAKARPPAAKAGDKPATEPLLDASLLLLPEDLAATLKRTTLPAFEDGRLQDEPASATYDSWHFKAVGKPESHDLAFRIWRQSRVDLDKRWTELTGALPNVVAAAPIGAALAFQAQEPAQRIFGHGFYDKHHRVIVLVTCGEDLCTTAGEARAFATLIHGRLGRLR